MNDTIIIPGAPDIPGLTFRRFRGETDYPHMAALIAACKVADGVERSNTLDDVAHAYRHLVNCDPQADMLFAEVDGQVIAYGRIWWDDQVDGIRLYFPFGFLHPHWRGKGIGSALWAAAEKRACQIGAGHPQEMSKFLQAAPFDSEKALATLLESRGYQPVRYETHMLRNLGEPFPEAPMPPGLEVRPVKPEHYRPIFVASNEAFRDH
jgi:mycothiol synthase